MNVILSNQQRLTKSVHQVASGVLLVDLWPCQDIRRMLRIALRHIKHALFHSEYIRYLSMNSTYRHT